LLQVNSAPLRDRTTLGASKHLRALGASRALSFLKHEAEAEVEEFEQEEVVIVKATVSAAATGASRRSEISWISCGSMRKRIIEYRARSGIVVYRGSGSRRLAMSIQPSKGALSQWLKSADAHGSYVRRHLVLKTRRTIQLAWIALSERYGSAPRRRTQPPY
jgi:hypothetical protein